MDEGSAPTVVLVEGLSDKLAIEALAERRGRDLASDGVAVLSCKRRRPARFVQ